MSRSLLTLLAVLAFVLCCAPGGHAQNANTITLVFPGVPTGTCFNFEYGINNANGNLYDCHAGSWNLISGGGGGSGCIPPGGTGDLLYDNGAFGCNDLTTPVTIAQGGTSLAAVPGTPGQLIYNNAGAYGAEDPIVSGPTAIGSAPGTNPVFVGTWDGTNIRVPLTTNTTPGGSDYALETRNIPSGTQTVSGTVTSNAGTNLNTSLLALESGGNLAAIKADTDKIPSLGQALAAGSVPVVLTAAQLSALTPLTSIAVTNVGTFAVQAAQSGTWTVTGTGGTFPVTAASGAYASGSISDGAEVTLGAKADAKSTATDTTAITAQSVLKEISYMEQNPASRAVTNGGTFATQSAITAASGSIASGAIASGAVASGAIASGAIASGACASGCVADGGVVTLGAKADAKSAATDTTAITAMQVLKEISYMAQNPAALPADQSVNTAQVNAVTVLTGAGATGTGSQRMTVAQDATTNAGATPDPCAANTKTFVNINVSTNTKLVTGTSAKKLYVCSISIPPQSAAVNFALVEGTGSTCGTSTVALPGITGGDGTAAKGAVIPASGGGFMLGNGASSVGQSATAADDTCAFVSAQLSGGFSYVVQ